MVDNLEPREFVLGGFLIGSFASGSSDDLSDIDICFVVQRDYWDKAFEQMKFLIEREDLIHTDHALHGNEGSFVRCIFNNFTSTEVHFIGESSSFELYMPYHVLFDKTNSIEHFISTNSSPNAGVKPALSIGDEQAAWDLFNIFMKSVRGDFNAVICCAEKLIEEHRGSEHGDHSM